MKKPFEVGDRVINYGRDKQKAIVLAINTFGVLVRHDHDGCEQYYYPQVLRHLKPRKKMREVWITESDLSHVMRDGARLCTVSKDKTVPLDTLFREVRRK